MRIIIAILLLLITFINCRGQELHFFNKNIWVSENNKENPHVEPHLAINPLQENQMVVASMMYSDSSTSDRIVTYYSNDSGNNWYSGLIERDNIKGVDPWVAYDKNGTVYLVYLPGYVHFSTDNGKNWTDAIRIPGDPKQPYDFIKINTTENYVCISASQSIRDENNDLVGPISIIRATKDLSEFGSVVQILPGNFDYQIGVPQSMPGTDSLMIPFYELTDINGDLLDYNRIWFTLYNAKTESFTTPRWSGFEGGSPTVILNPKINTRFHLFWYERTEESWTMKTSYSDNAAIHWSKPYQVEDIVRLKGDYGVQPTVATNNNGIIGVIWPDHRTDSLNIEYGVYFTYSSDSGKTYSKSVLISETTSSPITEGNQIEIHESGRTVADRFAIGGDYYGLVSLGENEFIALWSDNKTGVFQLWLNKLKLK